MLFTLGLAFFYQYLARYCHSKLVTLSITCLCLTGCVESKGFMLYDYDTGNMDIASQPNEVAFGSSSDGKRFYTLFIRKNRRQELILRIRQLSDNKLLSKYRISAESTSIRHLAYRKFVLFQHETKLLYISESRMLRCYDLYTGDDFVIDEDQHYSYIHALSDNELLLLNMPTRTLRYMNLATNNNRTIVLPNYILRYDYIGINSRYIVFFTAGQTYCLDLKSSKINTIDYPMTDTPLQLLLTSDNHIIFVYANKLVKTDILGVNADSITYSPTPDKFNSVYLLDKDCALGAFFNLNDSNSPFSYQQINLVTGEVNAISLPPHTDFWALPDMKKIFLISTHATPLWSEFTEI